MASQIGLLRSVLSLDSEGFRQGFERAQASMMTFQKRVRRMEFKMKRFGRKMEGIGQSMTFGLTLPILGAGTQAVRSAAEFETLAVQMEVLTGSAEAGRKAFEQLKRFSARTPFQLRDLTKAQNTLMGFGAGAEEAFGHLKMLGDIAAVTGGDLQAITVAFGQARAEGKLMTRDIRQLINQGVPAITLLADSLGVAENQVLDLAEQGEITFDVLVNAFQEATQAGGKFAGGTERLADTIGGVFSTLKDNISIAMGEIGEVIVDTLDLKQLGKDLSVGIQTITEMFRNMSDESRTQMLKIAGLFAISGPVAFAIGKFVSLLAGGVRVMRKLFTLMVSIVTTAMGRIGVAFILGITIGQRFFDNMKALFTGNLQDWRFFWQDWGDTAVKAIKKTFGPVFDLADKGFGALAEGIGDLTGMNAALGQFWKNFEKNTKNAKESTEELGDSISNTVSALPVGKDPIQLPSSIMQVGSGLIPSGKLKKAEGSTNSLAAALVRVNEIGEELAANIAPMVGSAVADMAESFISGMAKIAAAGGSIGNVFKGVLSTLADLAIRVGKIAIGVGIAIEGIKKALQSLNPVAAVAAGIALIALGTIAKTALSNTAKPKKVPELAQGGVAFGPTMAVVGDNPNARSNPEVIAPLDKLKGLIGRGQVIENIIMIDGKELFRNQKDVKYKVGR